MKAYDDLIKQLFQVNLFGGVKLGLTHCLLLSEALGHPEKAFETIHIAGSNGKGSVSKKIAAAYQASGKRTGLYISPHIACFRERISLNGEMISEAAIERLLPKIFNCAKELRIRPTFFEITTLLALCFFAEAGAETVVLETGLGGRLDATNIVIPRLSIITSISLEHTEILGATIEEIAREKAGIIKRGVPVVLGPRLPHDLMRMVAVTQESPVKVVEGAFADFEAENCAIARKSLELLALPQEAIEHGLRAKLPCRCEILEQPSGTVVLDAAHNPDGLKKLFEAIGQRYPAVPLRILFGLSKTKDLHGCLQIIHTKGTHFHLVEALNGRGTPVKQLEEILLALGTPSRQISTHCSIAQAVRHAADALRLQGEILVICGSFFILADARAALGIEEPRDPTDMNER